MLKKLASETAIYGLSSIVGRLINYLLVPLHANLFNPGGYGIVSVFYAWAAVLNVLYTYGMETAYFRYAGKGEGQRLFNVAFTSLLLSSLLLSGLLIAFAGPVASFLGYPGSERYVVWFALLIAADNISAIPFARLRQEKKAVLFASIKLANIGLNVVLNVFFIIFCAGVFNGNYALWARPFVNSFYDPNLGLGYAFLSNLIASLALLPLLWPAYRGFRLVFKWEELKPLYLYGYPILISGIFYVINEVVDRILLERWLPEGFYKGLSNTEAVGVYSACYKLSIFITLAVQAYKYAAEPFFFSRAGSREQPALLAKSMTYFVAVCAIMVLGVSANVYWLGALLFTNETYWQGLGVVPILLMANLFLGVYYNLSFWFKLSDKTHYGAWIGAGGATITLLGNLILIPILGYFGSAWATMLCYGSMAAICYVLGQRYFFVPYKTMRILTYLLIAGGLSAVCVMFPVKGWIGIAYPNMLLCLFVGGVISYELQVRSYE